MANLVMERLLPSLQTDLLPRLKTKKSEKKRVWFAVSTTSSVVVTGCRLLTDSIPWGIKAMLQVLMPLTKQDNVFLQCLLTRQTEPNSFVPCVDRTQTVEAAYFLVQEHLAEGLSELKEECQKLAQRQEVLMHSDLDQILSLRRQLEGKIQGSSSVFFIFNNWLTLKVGSEESSLSGLVTSGRSNNGFFPSAEKVSEPAQKLCSETVQPYLGSILEELMEPISSGFQEGRELSESMMDQVYEHFLVGAHDKQVQKVGAIPGSGFDQRTVGFIWQKVL